MSCPTPLPMAARRSAFAGSSKAFRQPTCGIAIRLEQTSSDGWCSPREDSMDISAIGRQFGLNEEQTRAALDALVPVVGAGMRRTAQSPEGLQEILRQVLTGGHGASLDDGRAVSFDRAKPGGDEVLGQIFGDKQVSREVAQQLSATSGVGADILKKLLPIVATMVLGTLAKRVGSGGGMPGEQIPQPRSDGGGGLGDILRDVLGGGPRGGGQAAPQHVPESQPMPAPQSGGGSLEDVLGDILGGGGGQGRVVAKQIPPDQMGDILRDIFGGDEPGGGRGFDLPPERRPSDEAVTRGRNTLDDMLGRGTSSGNAADDLLNSVERSIRGR